MSEGGGTAEGIPHTRNLWGMSGAHALPEVVRDVKGVLRQSELLDRGQGPVVAIGERDLAG